MSFSSNFLNLIIDSNCDLSVKSKYLDEGRHFNYFSSLDNKQVELIKQKINSSIALHNKRPEGFLLLSKYLEECQHLLVLNESVSWATSCLQSSTVKNAFEKQLAFVCLNRIFNAASNSPEIYRMLSGTIVPQFIDLLPQMKIENSDQRTVQEFSGCFEICVRTFKGPCSSRRKIIEDFIFKMSASANFLQLARSFALLAFTGSHKQLQTNNCFNQFMINCVYSLDRLIDANFNETHPLPYYSSIQERPLLELNNVGRMEKTLDFLNKFKFLCSVIQHLLVENFDGQVKIPIGLVLNLIQRMVSFKVNKQNTTANLESILNSNIIPVMYKNALLVLNQLIITCSTNLSTNLKEINKILIDLSDYFSQQNEKNYLIEIKSLWYSVITNWFNKLGNHLTVLISKQWEEMLISNFLDDIQLKKNRLELHNTKQLQNERSTNTKFTDSSYFVGDELELCLNACQTMDSFLIHFSRLINAKKFHKFIYQLLTIIQDLYRIDLWRKSTYFIDSKLRLQLLKVFRNCLISFTNTSLLNNAITILNNVLRLDKSSDIQLFAKETLIIINSPKNKVYFSTQEINLVDNVMNCIGKEVTEEQIVNCIEKEVTEKQIVNCIEEKVDKEQIEDQVLDQVVDQVNGSHQKADQIVSKDNEVESNETEDEEFTSLMSPNDLLNGRNSLTEVSESIDKMEETNKILVNKEASYMVESLVNVLEENKTLNDLDEKVLNDTVNRSTVKRVTRTKIKSAAEDSTVATTRLTRSSMKKKLEENDQKSQKKIKIQDVENSVEKQLIDEDSEGEIEDILKDFVDA